MRNLTATLCLTLAVLLGSAGVSVSQDFQKGVDAYERGDYAIALREWTPLAERGVPGAQYNLGRMYVNGWGVPQDYKTAAKWFTLAAEQGYAEAQFNLGVMYNNGEGVPQDYKTAVKWFTLAAEQGNEYAQYNLGERYYDGDGVPQDYVYAHMWGNIAASNGNENGEKLRDLVAERMTPSQIERAQDLARKCVAKNYKGC
jgi:TPR repeat protein